MTMIGVLGGMGPAATVDLLDKLVRLTPASRDQEHIPVIAASLPHIPDRSACILGAGENPLPHLLRGIDILNNAGVGLVLVPCNSAHHWYEELCARSKAPVLHIAKACVERITQTQGSRVLILATRGALRSGFYQRELAKAGLLAMEPDPTLIQPLVDKCIQQVKSGAPEEAGKSLGGVLELATKMSVSAVIMGCTEIPIAARHCDSHGLEMADSSLALAEAAVNYAVERRWHLAMTDGQECP